MLAFPPEDASDDPPAAALPPLTKASMRRDGGFGSADVAPRRPWGWERVDDDAPVPLDTGMSSGTRVRERPAAPSGGDAGVASEFPELSRSTDVGLGGRTNSSPRSSTRARIGRRFERGTASRPGKVTQLLSAAATRWAVATSGQSPRLGSAATRRASPSTRRRAYASSRWSRVCRRRRPRIGVAPRRRR